MARQVWRDIATKAWQARDGEVTRDGASPAMAGQDTPGEVGLGKTGVAHLGKEREDRRGRAGVAPPGKEWMGGPR